MGRVVLFSETYRLRPIAYRPAAGDLATVIILPVVRIERTPRRSRKLENRRAGIKTKP